MAHTKAGGSTSLGRDSVSKRLGVKKYGGQSVVTGNVIVRQHGSSFRAGTGTTIGKDYTIMAAISGIVKFSKRKVARFTGKLKSVNIVSVIGSNKK